MSLNVTAVILAAGMGTRMRSAKPKVMHKVAGFPMLEIILRNLTSLKVSDIRVVVGPELKSFAEFAKLEERYNFTCHLQSERLGTAHALKTALSNPPTKPVLVLAGDSPLIKKTTLKNFYRHFVDAKSAVSVLGFFAPNPFGYGRMLEQDGRLLEIVEEKDASDIVKQNNYCNSGVYLVDEAHCINLLEMIDNSNAAGEYYLTDVVKLANNSNLVVTSTTASYIEALGVNDKLQLAIAEKFMQQRLRKKALKQGVTLVDKDTVFFAHDTTYENDVTVEPHVVFGPNVVIGAGTTIRSFSHLEGVVIGSECTIGPFARIRPDSRLGNHCRIGNFVEVKSSTLKSETKAAHLSYIGDATIEDNVNIGAGTIFCNYDGYRKHQVTVGADTFIGSNSALVAPLSIGKGVIIGAGSVVTEDVEDSSLTIARARQVNYPHRAELARRSRK